MSELPVLFPEWWAFATQKATLEPAPAPPRILWPSPEEVRRIIEEAGKTGVFPIIRAWRPEECAGDPSTPAQTADRDGPLVPLPAKPAPERVVPLLPFTAYQAMLRG